MDYILIFKNTHDALHCEKVLSNVGVKISVIPTPSNITKSCGISIGINYKDLGKVRNEINNIKVIKIYDVKNDLVMDL